MMLGMDSDNALNEPSLIQTSKFLRLSLWSHLPATPNQPLRLRVEHIEWPRPTLHDKPSLISLQCVSVFPERHYTGSDIGRSDDGGGIREKQEVLFTKDFPIDAGTILLRPSSHSSGQRPIGFVDAFSARVCDCACHSRRPRASDDDIIEEQFTLDSLLGIAEPSVVSTSKSGCDHCGDFGSTDPILRRLLLRETAAARQLALDNSLKSVADTPVDREQLPSGTSASPIDMDTDRPFQPKKTSNASTQQPVAVNDNHPASPPRSSQGDSAVLQRPKTFFPSVLPADWESQRDAGIGLFGGYHIAIPSCFPDGQDIMPTFQDTVQLGGRSGSVRCQIRWCIIFRNGFDGSEIRMEIPVVVPPPRLPGVMLDFLKEDTAGARLLLSRHGDVSWVPVSPSSGRAGTKGGSEGLPLPSDLSTPNARHRICVPVTLRIVQPSNSNGGSKTTSTIENVLFRLIRTTTVLPPPMTTDAVNVPSPAGGSEHVIIFQGPNTSVPPVNWKVMEACSTMSASEAQWEDGVWVFRCVLIADIAGEKPTVQTQRLVCQYHVESTVVRSSSHASPPYEATQAEGPVLRITVPPPPFRDCQTADQAVRSSSPVPMPLDDPEKLALLLYCATDSQIDALSSGQGSGSLRADIEMG